MNAEIITIGDELLRGEIVDSNKARIAERLLLHDLDCRHQVSVLDDPADMREVFLRAVERSDFVLVSGGLGPTRDDLTTEVLAETFGRKLELHADSLAAIEAFFARVGREMAEVNRKQAFFPTGADVLPNPIGTAPGFALEVDRGARRAWLFVMPGVPRELDRMMDEQVLPRIAATLARSGPRRVVRAALLRTFGMGESTLEASLVDLARDGEVELGFRTTFPDNVLRPVARAGTAAEADARIARAVEAIRERLGPIVYGTGSDTMESVVGGLLRERGLTIATAESCTGGLIAERITDVPGSSAYFLGGIVSYSNAAKAELLGVSQASLEREGAVSEPVVRAMAEGARARFGCDLAVATSGISGPDGGTAEKPVGLVWIALAAGDRTGRAGTHADSFVFQVDRSRHRALTAQVALDWIRRHLLGFELAGPTLMRRLGGGSTPGGGSGGR
ncbi:MAG: competence/damage-inducible protein A [Spirochaetaceae bacterium]|nr:competence/damage-inducible protein A [Myxococcales bacterium]MCB9723387.1 competence/damage-inducible protein A [Spirochaetaceae bacterium]HPG26628.1 competence/damage-inducible protein A [Myxococcota bacterium]